MKEIIENDLNIIRDTQLIKECLELRLSLIGQNNSLKSEYEKNEDDIIRIKTQIEVNRLNGVIIQKTYDVRDNLKALEIEQE
jgi:hypothetical protein